jgi:chorismate mutase
VGWRVQAIRGATTATANTVEAIREAVWELLDELESRNQIQADWIISATFSVTPDLDAIFPAKIARERSDWGLVPLLDVQQMQVKGSLDHCIRLLIHVNLPEHHTNIHHAYLRGAKDLRPDLSQDDYSATGSNQTVAPRKSIPELIN